MLVLCGAALTTTARAAVDKREIEARADFAAGRYQHAIDLFAQLYGETLNPIYLRNVGRCQQSLRQPQPAINSYREYLKKAKGMKADERREIEDYIKEMEAMLAAPPPASPPPPDNAPASTSRQPSAPSAPPPQTATPAPTPSPGLAIATASSPAAAPTLTPATPATNVLPGISAALPTPEGHVQHPWRMTGIVVTAAGAFLIGTGVAFGISARHDATAVSATYDSTQAAAGKRNQWIGAAADIAGAAAVLTGIVLVTHISNASAPAVFGLRAGALADSHAGLLLLRGTF